MDKDRERINVTSQCTEKVLLIDVAQIRFIHLTYLYPIYNSNAGK